MLDPYWTEERGYSHAAALLVKLQAKEATHMEEQPRCLEAGPDCAGKVELHLNPDRDDFKAFPRCEFHQARRLEQAERNLELLSDVPPRWFDPAYAGERWDED